MLKQLRLSLQYDRGQDAEKEKEWLDNHSPSWSCDHCGDEFKMYLRPSIIRYEDGCVWLCRSCLFSLAEQLKQRMANGEQEERARKLVMIPVMIEATNKVRFK